MSDKATGKRKLLRSIVVGISIVLLIASGIVIFYNLGAKKSPEQQAIEALKPFGNPAVENAEVAGKRVLERIELIEPKEAYNFELTNYDLKEMSLKDFEGKLVLLGFIYTNCPDVCGILTQHFRYIQRKFDHIVGKELELIFITTDPERDTPERLKAYTKGFGGKWYFFTGSEEELQKVWDAYRVFVKEGRPGAGVVYHTYMAVLINRRGEIEYRYVGLVDPEEVISQDILYLLQRGGSVES